MDKLKQAIRDYLREDFKMDKLEQAMQNKDFEVELTDESFGSITLSGRCTNPVTDIEYYEVAGEDITDGDFAVMFFKSYEKMKKWFDEWKGEGFYDYLVDLYEKMKQTYEK